MFIFFSILVIFLLLSIVGLLFNFDRKQKEIARQLTVTLNIKISNAKHCYKLDIDRLCEVFHLSSVIRWQLYSIANNYFVFQTITIDSVENLQTTLQKLSLVYNEILAFHEENGDDDRILECIILFSESLPTQSIHFNVEFYTVKIIELTKRLQVIANESCENNQVDNNALISMDNELLKTA